MKNGWPIATPKKWDKMLKGHKEYKKYKFNPPSFWCYLGDMFHGVAVDGSTAYVPGQPELEQQQQSESEDDEDEDEDDAVEEVTPPQSGRSSSSQKRSSTSTAQSTPVKRTKNAVVNELRSHHVNKQLVLDRRTELMEREIKLKEAAAERKKNIDEQLKREQDKKQMELARVTKVALDAGVLPGSRAHLWLSFLVDNHLMLLHFDHCETDEQRLQFLTQFGEYMSAGRG